MGWVGACRNVTEHPNTGMGGVGGKDVVPSKGGWEGLLLNADAF